MWKTILSLPIKWTRLVSSSFQYFSQLSASNSLVAVIYPIGASNQTYNTFPSASFTGTLTPQSRSLVIALGFSPSFNHDLHWPITFDFQSFLVFIYFSIFPWSLSIGKYQFFVSLKIGALPDKLDFGFFKSIGISVLPHISHWSP